MEKLGELGKDEKVLFPVAGNFMDCLVEPQLYAICYNDREFPAPSPLCLPDSVYRNVYKRHENKKGIGLNADAFFCFFAYVDWLITKELALDKLRTGVCCLARSVFRRMLRRHP